MAILQIVEWADSTGNEMVHRVPERGSGEFRFGSQLIVRESQAGVFFRDGKAYDTFGPGRHTLSTANIPLLVNLLSLPFGGQSPFKAVVYFVNLKQFTDLKWGTPQPIPLRDRDLGMVRLRTFGSYAIQIGDPALFVNTIVGTQNLYSTSDIQGYLRGMIISKFTDVLGTLGMGFLDLAAKFEELGAAVKVKVRDDFAALGVTLLGLYIQSITPTEDTEKAIDERASMGAIGDMQSYLQFKAARAMGDAAVAGGGEAGGAVGTGFGLGAGAGMGAMMAQILGQAAQPRPATPAAGDAGSGGGAGAGAPAAPAGPQSVDQAFAAVTGLVQSQLAIPQQQRDTIVQQVNALAAELGKPDGDLSRIKSLRKEIATNTPWLAPELDKVFQAGPVERAMADAARRFMES
ncbi:MAG TPA: SPFH domain-containing protein [Ardenticatenaceae bacterium]|nr:SPFH domain-containing protein [Ardenticatenaceae bacterium]